MGQNVERSALRARQLNLVLDWLLRVSKQLAVEASKRFASSAELTSKTVLPMTSSLERPRNAAKASLQPT